MKLKNNGFAAGRNDWYAGILIAPPGVRAGMPGIMILPPGARAEMPGKKVWI
jgi:hypothetical protein